MIRKASNVEKHVLLTSVMMIAIVMISGTAYAEFAPETVDDSTPYALSDITHMLGVMDAFVIVDENLHLIINKTAASLYPEISELDISMTRDFIVHSDALIDATKVGPVGHINELESTNPQLLVAFTDLKNGRFSELFEQNYSTEIRTTLLDVNSPIIYPTYFYLHEANAFGTSNVVPIHHGTWGPNCPPLRLICDTVCGGGLNDHHIKKRLVPSITFDTKLEAITDLVIKQGYHQIRIPATSPEHHTFDFAKKGQEYGCNDGEFRDQALIKPKGTQFYYDKQGPEVNPELWTYDWPASWWGLYVAVWHAIN